MLLAPGTRLGPYEIQSGIGQGGMGVVYSALDTRLDRTVAIKVLRPEFSTDAGRRARFEREARIVAGLNHANICTLHDVGEHQSPTTAGQPTLYLVMEHVAGETLADRLRKGPLPLERALAIAAGTAEALAAAHAQGIVHRDLKPANIMLTKAGPKLLDFGLGRLTEAVADVTSETSSGAHAVVGTVPYMAPEQVEGRALDFRADIFAFGTVLYEMLSGRRAFEGESPAGVMASILHLEPTPVSKLAPAVPPVVERIVQKCLAKDPEARWQSAADLADELRWAAQGPPTHPGASVEGRRARRRSALLVAAGMVLAGVVAGGAGVWYGSFHRRAEPSRVPRRYHLDVGPADFLGGPDPRERSFYGGRPLRRALTVSPDGRFLVFAGHEDAVQRLYLRDVEQGETKAIPGTEGGESPAFSPDGRSVAFWAHDALRKVDLRSGTVSTICGTSRLFGAAWGNDGTIVFANLDGPLRSVPASGGSPTGVTALRDGEVAHRLPHLLPGGAVVYVSDSYSGYRLCVERLNTHERKIIGLDQARGYVVDARYVESGHLVYGRNGTLEAVPFDG